MRWLLLPFSLLYGFIVILRNKCFDWGIFKQSTFPIPVISVGNVTVGGTGKTPHSEFLIHWLEEKFSLALLSRGYKRKTTGFLEVQEHTHVSQVGDEPLQIKQKFPDILVAVDEKRKHGIEQLLAFPNKPELVILDDAFQHRHVLPTYNILLMDFNRTITHDFMLPAGNLREPAFGKARAHCVIVTKCPRDLPETEMEMLKNDLNLKAHQQLYFTAFTYGGLIPVFNNIPRGDSEPGLQGFTVLAVSGIAQPASFYKYLQSLGTGQLIKIEFPDHHSFTGNDTLALKLQFEQIAATKKLIITTEKDAVRLRAVASKEVLEKLPLFYIPIEVFFLKGEETKFKTELLKAIKAE